MDGATGSKQGKEVRLHPSKHPERMYKKKSYFLRTEKQK
jgi:hypothetical protein